MDSQPRCTASSRFRWHERSLPGAVGFWQHIDAIMPSKRSPGCHEFPNSWSEHTRFGAFVALQFTVSPVTYHSVLAVRPDFMPQCGRKLDAWLRIGWHPYTISAISICTVGYQREVEWTHSHRHGHYCRLMTNPVDPIG